jgi:(p)ppGpp synthase/HD superfamily hydrolase
MLMVDTSLPWSGQEIGEAVALATELHRGQLRKGTTTPYISHLFAVAALVMEDAGQQESVIAALLHDAAEDQGGEETLTLITDRFGPRVGRIVRECSDALPVAGEEKAPWRIRKEAYIAALPGKSREALFVTAADKLHNTQCTLTDLRMVGSDVWGRFKTGRVGFLWYHTEVLRGLENRIPASRSVAGFRRVLTELVDDAG